MDSGCHLLRDVGDTIVGIEINKARWLLIPVFVVFAAGFFLAFRTAYSKNSKLRPYPGPSKFASVGLAVKMVSGYL
jgi:hypothetical protein